MKIRSGKPSIIMLTEKYPPLYSGAGRQACYLSQILVKSGYKVTVLTQMRKGLPQKIVQEGIQVFRLNSVGGTTLSSYIFGLRAALWLLIHIRRFHILHVHGINFWGLPAMLIARLLRRRVLAKMTLLGEDDPQGLEKMTLGKIRKHIFLIPHKIVAVSSLQAEQYAKSKFSAHKLILIPNGVNLDIFFPVSFEKKSDFRKKLNLPTEKKIVLFIGKISYRKGVALLIDAWIKYLKNRNFILCLVGPENKERGFCRYIHQKIASARLEQQIKFLGEQEQPVEFLQASDLFVLPSIREGLPNALLEAMACGLPSVVLDIPEISALLNRKPPVLMILKDYNPLLLAHGILQVINSKRGRCLGQRAHKLIISEFSIESIARKYENLYHEMIQ